MMSGYFSDDLTAAEIDALHAVIGPLTNDARALIDATVRTEVDDAAIAAAREHIAAATALLADKQLDGSFGVRFGRDGTKRAWGNAVMGAQNPIAAPVDMVFPDPDAQDQICWAEFDLGAAYEGPAGLVHGGMLAAILDQALGAAAEHAGAPGMTGTLTIRYRQGTKLGRVRVDAWLDRVEGVKSFAKGTISTADGICAEAEGVFILPRWAREASAAHLRSGVGDA